MTASEHSTECDTLNRVERSLRMYESRRTNQKRVLQLFTVIEQTLEATRPDLPVASFRAAPSSGTAGPDHTSGSFDPSHSIDVVAQRLHKGEAAIASALSDVLRGFDQLKYRAGTALSSLSGRVSRVDNEVRRLAAAARDNTMRVNERTERIRQQTVRQTAALVTLATVVRLGCKDSEKHSQSSSEVESGSERTGLEGREEPACIAAVRAAFKSLEETTAAAIAGSVEAHEAVASTTCSLLRAGLMEEFKARRYFPSQAVWQQRREAQAAWSRRLRDGVAQRKAAEVAKWKHHGKAVVQAAADIVVEGALTTASSNNTNRNKELSS